MGVVGVGVVGVVGGHTNCRITYLSLKPSPEKFAQSLQLLAPWYLSEMMARVSNGEQSLSKLE